MALTIGGSGINNSSMFAGIGASGNTGGGQGTNNSNMGMYNANNMPDQEKGNNSGNGADLDNVGEDLIMMNIPREGNADQLNKSTKLTLSSKKQYDNHLQNIPLHQHINNSNQQN